MIYSFFVTTAKSYFQLTTSKGDLLNIREIQLYYFFILEKSIKATNVLSCRMWETDFQQKSQREHGEMGWCFCRSRR